MTISALVPLRDTMCDSRYFHDRLPGSRRECLLELRTAERLDGASRHLASLSRAGRQYGLLVWDAHRTVETQRAIFDAYACRLSGDRATASLESKKLAEVYVSSPDGVFPHGTGGAVDLTLVVNGRPARMGTCFDEFAPASASDWYFANPPMDDGARESLANRALLHFVMTSAGFVAHPEEWWHFEWGTHRWASAVGCDPVLDRVMSSLDSLAG